MADILAPRLRDRGIKHVEVSMGVAAQEARTSKFLGLVESGGRSVAARWWLKTEETS
jgi:hypothetical protein